ncbi:uncharacterized protein LOC116517180 isoform X2 [Thamnophis elegans]|uniref:uncharacterized protein LOC116517180 isoform X2 n=1 Tax=Thamnophis elegans TaxID=35005 RepID=UPI001376B9B8|nr:uncharacterized protein LOC116517180 isoform X2 [Thamnophis elegans]
MQQPAARKALPPGRPLGRRLREGRPGTRRGLPPAPASSPCADPREGGGQPSGWRFPGTPTQRLQGGSAALPPPASRPGDPSDLGNCARCVDFGSQNSSASMSGWGTLGVEVHRSLQWPRLRNACLDRRLEAECGSCSAPAVAAEWPAWAEPPVWVGSDPLPNRLGQKGGSAPTPTWGFFVRWLSGELLLGQGAVFATQFCKGGKKVSFLFSVVWFPCSISCRFISLCINACTHARTHTHIGRKSPHPQTSCCRLPAKIFPISPCPVIFSPVRRQSSATCADKNGDNIISGSPIDKHGKPGTVAVGNCRCPVLPRHQHKWKCRIWKRYALSRFSKTREAARKEFR